MEETTILYIRIRAYVLTFTRNSECNLATITKWSLCAPHVKELSRVASSELAKNYLTDSFGNELEVAL